MIFLMDVTANLQMSAGKYDTRITFTQQQQQQQQRRRRRRQSTILFWRTTD